MSPRIVILAVIATSALAFAQDVENPSLSTEDGNMHIRIKRQDGDLRITRQVSASFAEITDRLDTLETAQTTYATASSLAEARVEMTSRAADAAMGAFLATTSQIQQVTSTIGGINAQQSTTTAALMSTVASLESSQASMRSTMNALSTSIGASFDQVGEISTTIGTLTGPGSIIERINKTYVGDSSLPVYRYKYWHTYSNSFSWFDGNTANGFAGINPSTWTDGNGIASNMANDWRYLNRLFTEKATASKFGATICAETRIFYSSTDGGVCGAVFRINNPSNSAVLWRPNLFMTSYTGWSEMASISVNRANTWTSNCQSGCSFTASLSIPANRISTVVFISTSSYYSGGSGSFYQRSTVLMFKDYALTLPGGLEYVDDHDTLTGTWT